MKRIINFYFGHYYWLFLILAILNIFGIKYFAESLLLINVFFFLIAFFNIRTLKPIDIFVFIYISYSFLSILFSDYPWPLAYYGIKDQMIPIVFFFIARSKWFYCNEMAQGMKNPIVVAIIIGIILFVWRPGWYQDYIIESEEELSTRMTFLKNFQFKSVWPSTYGIAYSSLLLTIFLISKRFVYNIKEKHDLFVILICIIAVAWSLQRVCIAFLVLFLFLQIVYAFRNKRVTKIVFMMAIAIIAMVSIVGYYLVNVFLEDTDASFLIERFTDSDDGTVSGRVGLFSILFKYVSFWGNGLGRFGHSALLYNMDSVTDCEYLRFLCEVGFVGIFFFLLIIFSSLLRGLKYKKYLYYETMVVLFYMFAMIGAAPMESTPMQNFFFWFCMGLIHNDNLIKRKSGTLIVTNEQIKLKP